MTAIAAKDAEAFVRDGFRRVSLILIYGPDSGLVSERAETIARATVGGDAANIIRMEGDAVSGDPMSLADEANAISMFGGARAIRVRAGSRTLAPAMEPLFATPPVDARIIIEGGDWKPDHALRKAFEKAANAAAVPCYVEEGRDLDRWLSGALHDAGVQITSDAREALLGALGADRKLSRSELDKLLLYVAGTGRITVEDVEAVVTDAAAISTDAVIDAAFQGRLDVIEEEARRVFADGVDPGVLMGFALRQALLLQSIRASSGGDRDVAESIKRHRVSWKRERTVADQVSRWTDARLARAIQLLGDAVLAIRRTAPLGEALAVRALWSLALAVNRKS